MLTKTKIILAAAVMFGAASAAQAADEHESGGYRIGPLGQQFAPRSANRQWLHDQKYGFAHSRAYDFAYVPGRPRMWHYDRDYW